MANTLVWICILEIELAKAKLRVEELDPEAVRTAYIARVKEVRDSVDFEKLLLELNVARDTLLSSMNGSRQIVPVLAKELAAISAKQNELAQINDARDEIRNVFGSVERLSINRIKGARDLTGLLSAASAALAFGKDNIAELLPSLTDATSYSQTLFICSAMFAFLAFMANRRAGDVSLRMDEINRTLTRDRQVNRLMLQVFGDDISLEEIKFEDRLQAELRAVTGARSRPNPILELYGALGFPFPIRIHLGREFVDDYIDYLSKSGYIKASGVSGRDMVFHKVI